MQYLGDGLRVFDFLIAINILQLKNKHFFSSKLSKPKVRKFVIAIGSAVNMGVGAYLFGEGYPSPMFLKIKIVAHP